MMVPRAISSAVEALLSVDRIAHFLDAPEVSKLPSESSDDCALYLDNAHIRWPGTSNIRQGAPLLRRVTASIKKGLCAVLGETGSWQIRTTLSLAGRVRRHVWTTGRLRPHRVLRPISLDPERFLLRKYFVWCIACDKKRYQETIRRCALRDDLKALADGDRTQIGEKGLTLSGGQKQRAALARAFYAGADAYLFDDCLSAVDAHVAAHLFSELVCHLRDTGATVVLVTHNLSTIRRCDVVLELNKGEVSYVGNPQEYLEEGQKNPEAHPLAAPALKHKQNGSSSSLVSMGKDVSSESSDDEVEANGITLNTTEHRTRGVVKSETRTAYLAATGGWRWSS